MSDGEKCEWMKGFLCLSGIGFVLATFGLVATGSPAAPVVIGVWVWVVAITVALLFRATYLAGKRKARREG